MRKTVAALLICASLVSPSVAKNFDPDTDLETTRWYQSLVQPDAPGASCCGVADAYWCDGLHTKTDYLGNIHNFCTITDDRIIPNRTPAPIGMEIEIPDRKMMNGKTTGGNPTGHSIVFLSSGLNYVYCFILSGGI